LATQLEYTNAFQKRNVDAGLCPCGRERREGRAKCQKCAEDRKKWYEDHKELILEKMKQAHVKLKQEVFNHYGGICTCCGEEWLPFLQLDHTYGGGEHHRAQVKKETGSSAMYAWVKRNNFPDCFQVLCANCNMAKGANNKKCIHQLLNETKERI
jgi:hypothetical protein